MSFELQLLTGVILLLLAGAGGTALQSYVSTVQNSTDIENLKKRVERLENERDV